MRLRRERPALVTGDYRDLSAAGEGAEQIVAFSRGADNDALVAVVTRFPKHAESADLSGVSLELPESLKGREWLELLSGKTFTQDAFMVGDFPLPFAVLVSRNLEN